MKSFFSKVALFVCLASVSTRAHAQVVVAAPVVELVPFVAPGNIFANEDPLVVPNGLHRWQLPSGQMAAGGGYTKVWGSGLGYVYGVTPRNSAIGVYQWNAATGGAGAAVPVWVNGALAPAPVFLVGNGGWLGVSDTQAGLAGLKAPAYNPANAAALRKLGIVEDDLARMEKEIADLKAAQGTTPTAPTAPHAPAPQGPTPGVPFTPVLPTPTGPKAPF